MTTKTEGLSSRERADFIRYTKGLEVTFPELDVDPSDPQKYTRLQQAMRQDFVTSYLGEGSHSDAASSGFKALGKIIGRIPTAYVEAITTVNRNPDLEHLRELLLGEEHGSFEQSIGPITRIDRRRGMTVEGCLNLPTDFLKPAYSFLARGTVVGGYHAGNEALDHADTVIAEREIQGDLDPQKPGEVCPALTHLLPKIWKVAISGCIDDARYFPADIERALAGAA